MDTRRCKWNQTSGEIFRSRIMKKFISIIFIIVTSNCYSRNINEFESIYIDTAKNIHIIFPDGQDKKITKNGRAARATLAPDKHSAAWLVLNSWIAEGDARPSSSQLAIYRNSRLRYIKCEPFIRDYWFWMGGKQVAICLELGDHIPIRSLPYFKARRLLSTLLIPVTSPPAP